MSSPQLGFGIMRFQNKNGEIDYKEVKTVIDEYMKGQFCYFDVHPGYVKGMAQSILREYVVNCYPRESYKVANKVPYYSIMRKQDYERIFEEEIAECGCGYFDYYMLHAITKDVYDMHMRLGGFDFLFRKKAEGKVKKIGISFHDTSELLHEILSVHPEIEFVQLQINFYDWESSVIQSRACYEVARSFNKDIIVMEPIKGGSLSNPIKINGEDISSNLLAKKSLEFVARLDGISIILSGMTEKNQVVENRKTIANALSRIYDAQDLNFYDSVRKAYDERNSIPCTKCGYCKRECTRKIAIPEIINLINSSNTVGVNKRSVLAWYRIFYNGYISSNSSAGKCIGCKKCEQHCPQKIKIHEHMKQAREMFEVGYNKVTRYTDERNAQIVISLLKAHNIRKIIASPGMTNVCFIASVQTDPFFQIYSAPDERSAAYMACGLAEETGETVVLSCTGATASRNYYPGLTEAYYSQLPVLVITSSRRSDRIGHNFDQVTDRTTPAKDVAKLSVNAPYVRDWEDEWACEIAVNKAILEIRRHGIGPAHINLETMYSTNMNIVTLPPARAIYRYFLNDELPDIKADKIAIIVGKHKRWNPSLTEAVDSFCEKYNAAVFCDHTSNYVGEYKISPNLMTAQDNADFECKKADLIISIGDISSSEYGITVSEVWRVNPDGELRDTFWKLTKVFEMEEYDFFRLYASKKEGKTDTTFYNKCISEEEKLFKQVPELPFSNAWMASVTADRLPENSILHLGIRNSLRSWNYFRIPKTVTVYANTGGFGIDGSLSTVLGNSLETEKLCFCVLGDLAFFYDMNSLGNRHINKNTRILLVNNGTGMEMQFTKCLASAVGAEKDSYIAASGHYGNQSPDLVKHYAEDLGFIYLKAGNKIEYKECLETFVSSEDLGKPVILEAFVNKENEDASYLLLSSITGSKDCNSSNQDKKIKVSERLKNTENDEIVLFGTGKFFYQNLKDVMAKKRIKFACDNNPSKWGTEVAPGIICISPDELKTMKYGLVVIMTLRATDTMKIANQLLDMGIERFEHVSNWLQYEDVGEND